MKKFILILVSIFMIMIVYNKNEENETVKIPDSAIRFRVLANSNSPRDQKIKENIRDILQKELYLLLKNSKNTNEARTIINNNIFSFEELVKNELADENYSYEIDYGMHYFPEKTYKGITYDEGEYESLLVTLGEGKGNNWWCVLFPPLCVLEAEETTNTDETEYKFFIKEIIEKYF